VNVEGGAIAHGHPIGATGAILTTRLLHSMQRDKLKRGVVTLCIGGARAWHSPWRCCKPARRARPADGRSRPLLPAASNSAAPASGVRAIMSVNVFRHKGVRRFVVRLRVPLFVVALALLLPFAQRQWALAGFVVSMAGQLIQLWCFATLEKNETLASRGPYTMVRNPMYLGRYFLILGFVMLSGSWWRSRLHRPLLALHERARRREEAHLRPIFARLTTTTARASGASCRAAIAGPAGTRLELAAAQAEPRLAQPRRHADPLGGRRRLLFVPR